MVAVPFYSVNVIGDYNHFMVNVDISDQLIRSYSFDHWMLKKKWFWSIFFRAFQVIITNEYIFYKKYDIIHDLEPI